MSFFTFDGKNMSYQVTQEDLSGLGDFDANILFGVLDHQTYVEMGITSKKSPSTIQYRVEKLIEGGYITRRIRATETRENKRTKSPARSLMLTERGAAILIRSMIPIPVGTMIGRLEDTNVPNIPIRHGDRGTSTSVQQTME